MIQIDMNKLRATLPSNGKLTTHKKNGSIYFYCNVSWPNLSEKSPMTFEKDFDMILDWQRQIVGAALSEFYTETTGQFWYIYLKRVPLELLNASDKDIDAAAGIDIMDKVRQSKKK